MKRGIRLELWRLHNGKRWRKNFIVTSGTMDGIEPGDSVKLDGVTWTVQSAEPTKVWEIRTASPPDGSAGSSVPADGVGGSQSASPEAKQKGKEK